MRIAAPAAIRALRIRGTSSRPKQDPARSRRSEDRWHHRPINDIPAADAAPRHLRGCSATSWETASALPRRGDGETGVRGPEARHRTGHGRGGLESRFGGGGTRCADGTNGCLQIMRESRSRAQRGYKSAYRAQSATRFGRSGGRRALVSSLLLLPPADRSNQDRRVVIICYKTPLNAWRGEAGRDTAGKRKIRPIRCAGKCDQWGTASGSTGANRVRCGPNGG